jgi:2,3-bisphosphoglycerate-independent phosphoglycerate mutase
VMFISGWGAAPPSEQNFFSDADFRFLDQIVSSYPVVCLEPPTKRESLKQVYATLGGCRKKAPYESLPAVLDQYHIEQQVYADADRYGALTEVFHAGRSKPFEREEWEYIPLARGRSLAEVPFTSLPFLRTHKESMLKRNTNTVLYLAINGIWSVARSGERQAVKQAVRDVHEAVEEFVSSALQAQMRVLIVSDGGLAEQALFTEARTASPLPCVLVQKELEGLKASKHDWAEEDVLPLQASGALRDVAPTILRLMEILPPASMPGSFLFSQCFS